MLNQFLVALSATAASSGQSMPTAGQYGSAIVQFLPIIAIVVIFYFMLIRPQRKRDKAEKEMRSSIAVGDEISTIGGIIGKVVSIKDDVFVIESSSDRSRIRLYRWAIRGKEGAEDPSAAKVEKSPAKDDSKDEK